MSDVQISEDRNHRLLTINGFEIRGYLLGGSCKKCGGTEAFADAFDAPFCPVCNAWLEDVCADPNCAMCSSRPPEPRPRDETTPPVWYTPSGDSMPEIVLDGSSWQTVADFYEALLSALGAPEWHGHNPNALNDSLRGGDLNRVNPPMRIRISGYRDMPTKAKAAVDGFRSLARDLTHSRTIVVAVS